MRLPMRLKTILLAAAVIAVSFLVSLKAMDWLSPRGNGRGAGAGRIAAAAAGLAQLDHRRAGRDFARRDPRRRRPRRAAHLRRQGRQPGVADPAERRYRLDRLARTDRGDRRPGCAVAGDVADRNNKRDRLAVIEGDRRGRQRARQPARRQRRQADRQRQYQEHSTPTRKSRATSPSPRGPSSPRPGTSSPIWPARSPWATPTFRWPGPASTFRHRSSR